jgi:YHS domain-containing protein
MKLILRALFMISAIHFGVGAGSALAQSADAEKPAAEKQDDSKKAVDTKKPDEAGKAEDAKKPDDTKKAEDAKKLDDTKKAEDAKKAEDTKKPEDAKKPDVTYKPNEIYKSSAGLLGKKLAVGGYDAVAYHTQGKPVAGTDEFTHMWKGAEWRFSSKENLEAFLKEPEKYAPQYGGYCAFAVAHKGLSPGDPRHWRIVDGKLYLNIDASVQTKWNKDHLAFIKRGDANWPKVLK